jgi:hypothetical protein
MRRKGVDLRFDKSPLVPRIETSQATVAIVATCHEGTFGTVPRAAAIIMQTRPWRGALSTSTT